MANSNLPANDDIFCPGGRLRSEVLTEPAVRVVTPRAVRPSARETAVNPRAASARLRVAEKTS